MDIFSIMGAWMHWVMIDDCKEEGVEKGMVL